MAPRSGPAPRAGDPTPPRGALAGGRGPSAGASCVPGPSGAGLSAAGPARADPLDGPPDAVLRLASAQGWRVVGGGARGWALQGDDGVRRLARDGAPLGGPRLEALAGARHESLLGVWTLDTDGARVVLAEDVTDAVTVEELVEARGPLTPAEVALVGCTVARALAALHADGAVHGNVGGDHILVAQDGSVRVAPWTGPVPAGRTAADDVAALARLLSAVLAERGRRDDPSGEDAEARGGLRRVIAAGRAPDPERRPAAGTFAAWCDAAVPPAPVRVPDRAGLAAARLGGGVAGRAPVRPARAPVRPARARRHRAPAGPRTLGRAAVTAAASLAACAAAVVALAVLGPGAGQGPGSAPAPGTRPATTTTERAPADAAAVHEDPLGAARVLTARRVAALTGGTPQGAPADGGGTGTTLPGSAAQAAELAQLERLRADGVTVRGASVDVSQARPHPGDVATADRAVVDVVYRVGAHAQESGRGSTHVPASGPMRATLELEWTDAGWRVAEVS